MTYTGSTSILVFIVRIAVLVGPFLRQLPTWCLSVDLRPARTVMRSFDREEPAPSLEAGHQLRVGELSQQVRHVWTRQRIRENRWGRWIFRPEEVVDKDLRGQGASQVRLPCVTGVRGGATRGLSLYGTFIPSWFNAFTVTPLVLNRERNLMYMQDSRICGGLIN